MKATVIRFPVKADLRQGDLPMARRLSWWERLKRIFR
jgi:hypothetical protein